VTESVFTVLMKLKGCKTRNNFISHSLGLCQRLGKNVLGTFNLNIYLISWIGLSTKSHSLSLEKGSLQVTMLKNTNPKRINLPELHRNYQHSSNGEGNKTVLQRPIPKYRKLESGRN